MKKFMFLPLALIAMLFASCYSAMQVDLSAEPTDVEGSAELPDMEFIGFKADANALGVDTFKYWKYIQ